METEKKDQFVEETEVKDSPKTVEEKVEETSKEKAKENDGMPVWKSVLMGAFPGAVVGAVGVLAHQDALAVDEISDNIITNENPIKDEPVYVPEDTVKVAEGVDDSMSFSEAFRTARAEVGAGGAFTWHGQVYSTYYQNEWSSMSSEEQNQYGHALTSSSIHPEPWHSDPTLGPNPDTDPTPGPVQDPTPDSEPDDVEGEVEVVAVETVETPDGDVIDVAHGYVGDHAAAFVDVDRDDVVDMVGVDFNDNLEMDDNEVILPENDIHMSDLANAARDSMDYSPDGDLYSDTPDYTNDASIDDVGI